MNVVHSNFILELALFVAYYLALLYCLITNTVCCSKYLECARNLIHYSTRAAIGLSSLDNNNNLSLLSNIDSTINLIIKKNVKNIVDVLGFFNPKSLVYQ